MSEECKQSEDEAEIAKFIEAASPSAAGRPTLGVDETRTLEAEIARRGTSLSTLMEHAGHALAHAAEKAARDMGAKAKPRIVVLCGAGNNGGDGWVAARRLASDGCRVVLVSHCEGARIAAEPAREQAEKTMHAVASLPTLEVRITNAENAVREALDAADIAIDAMLGTGFSGATLREPYASWAKAANDARKRGLFVIAADTPSGLCAQTGRAATPCVKADRTITMIVPKPGLMTPYAFAFCGEVLVAPLADAEDIIEDVVRTRQAPRGKEKREKESETSGKRDPFRRAENEDDDGYDPYSDRPPAPTPLFEADPWN